MKLKSLRMLCFKTQNGLKIMCETLTCVRLAVLIEQRTGLYLQSPNVQC